MTKNEGKKVDNVATAHGPIHKRRKKNLDENADDKTTASTSLAIACTALHRLRPYSAGNEFLASFDEHCTLGEESSSCTFELSTSINSTDFSNTSTSNLQHASFSTPIHVLLEDTMHHLSIQHTVFTEDILLKTSHHIKVSYIKP